MGRTPTRYDAIGLPVDGEPLARLIGRVLDGAVGDGGVDALSPHATGTAAHRISESAALDRAFAGRPPPSVHVFKPLTGHTLGASGLLDAAFLAGSMARGIMPPNPAGLSSPVAGWEVPGVARLLPDGARVLKVAAGMGGHNAAVLLRKLPVPG